MSASTWIEIVNAVRLRRCDVAIVDPTTGGDHLAAERVTLLEGACMPAPAVPIIGYLSVSASGMRTVQSLARLGASEVVIRGVDDSCHALHSAVGRAVAACDGRGIVSAIAERLSFLPTSVATAIESAFKHPGQLRSVSDLAVAAHTTRRSLDRWLARAELPSARRLLACARANAAYLLLAGGTVRASQAASIVGYSSSRSLTREFQAITGQPASAVQRRLSRDAFAAAIERRLARNRESVRGASY